MHVPANMVVELDGVSGEVTVFEVVTIGGVVLWQRCATFIFPDIKIEYDLSRC